MTELKGFIAGTLFTGIVLFWGALAIAVMVGSIDDTLIRFTLAAWMVVGPMVGLMTANDISKGRF